MLDVKGGFMSTVTWLSTGFQPREKSNDILNSHRLGDEASSWRGEYYTSHHQSAYNVPVVSTIMTATKCPHSLPQPSENGTSQPHFTARISLKENAVNPSWCSEWRSWWRYCVEKILTLSERPGTSPPPAVHRAPFRPGRKERQAHCQVLAGLDIELSSCERLLPVSEA